MGFLTDLCIFSRKKYPKCYYHRTYSVDNFNIKRLQRLFEGKWDQAFVKLECAKTDLYENLKKLQFELETVPNRYAIALDMSQEEIIKKGESFKLSEHILFAVDVGSIFFDFNKPLDPSLKITKKSLEAKLIRTESPRPKA